jgi:hypothetical protein
MNIGTWNVLTLLKPGKMQELAEHIKIIKLDVAIQEIRWSGTGFMQKKDFSIIVEQIITLARLELAF